MSSKYKKKYTQAEKLAYYKKLSKGNVATLNKGPYKKKSTRVTTANRPKNSRYNTMGIGQKLGSSIGSTLGGWGGGLLGSGIETLVGFGDYVVPEYPIKKNSLLGMGNDPPEIRNTPDGRVIIRHREYLRDVITGSNGEFKVDSFKIQPGDPKTFPWLSQVASAYGQYKMRGMIFEFKSTSADALNSTNTALGTVVMATEYNSALPPFTNKSEMENHQFATSARQSYSIYHPIECARDVSVNQQLYINDGFIPNGDDPRLYDFAVTSIATVGQQSDTPVNIGELHCVYEIQLLKSQLNQAFQKKEAAFFENSSGITNAAPFGSISSMEASSKNNISMKVGEADAPQLISFPLGTRGSFMLIFTYKSPAASTALDTKFSIENDGITNTGSGPISVETVAAGAVAELNTVYFFFTVHGQSSTGEAPALRLAPVVSTGTVDKMTLYVTSILPGMSPDTVLPIVSESDPFFLKFKKDREAKFLREFLKYKEESLKEIEEDDFLYTTPESIEDQLSESTSAKLSAYLSRKQK